MKRVVSFVIFGVCGFIAYQSYQNAQPSPQIEAMARSSACAGADGCEVKGERPNVIQTSVMSRRFQFATSSGDMVVTCEREYIWLGEWSCSGAPGQLAY